MLRIIDGKVVEEALQRRIVEIKTQLVEIKQDLENSKVEVAFISLTLYFETSVLLVNTPFSFLFFLFFSFATHLFMHYFMKRYQI